MIISQSGIVDIIPEYNRQLRPIFCVSEGDKNTRMINITVQQAGENFSIPSGASVYVTGKKQDNTIFTYSCTKSGYIVSFQIAEQMSAANGIVLCELQIIENGNPLGSANFVYWVEPSPVQDGTASESDLNVFLEAIIGADKLDHFWANVEEAVTEAVEAIQIHEGQTVIDASLSVSGAAADAKATGDMARNFLEALMTETTTEAGIATIDDGAGGMPLKQFVGNIQPAQAGSGDPSPTNVRQISGYTSVTVTRTGKNIAKPIATTTTMGGLSWAVTADGKVTATGTATGTSQVNYDLQNNVLSLPKNVPLIVNGSTASLAVRVCYRTTDAPSTTVTLCTSYNGADATGTIPGNAKDSWVRVLNDAGTGVAINAECYPFVRIGGTAEYEAPAVDTYTVTFPSAAGTVYGGTLIVNPDGTGALTVDRAEFTSNSASGWATVTTANVLRHTAPTPTALATLATDPTGILSNETNVTRYNYNDMKASYPAVSFNSSGQLYIAVSDDVATAADLGTWLAEHPLQVVYPIAAPTTYALSAVQVAQMLQGDNNIWMDAAGMVQAEYYASTGLYVEKRVNAQRNMIAGVEEAMIATKNYAVGDLLIVGNTLYKVTAAISSGAALVVGTNVTETTVAEQLLALA